MASGCLPTITAPASFRVYASTSSSTPRPPPPPRRINGTKPLRQPSVAEVQMAIGVADEDTLHKLSSSTSSSSSSFMDLVALTPIGQAEGPIERKAREIAEWTAEHAEAHGRYGQQILLLVCLKILPVWLLLLLVASGFVKLPFDIPFMNDLFA